MEKAQVKKFGRQISFVYLLAIIHIILSVLGLLLNKYHFRSDYFFYSIIGLNVMALICFQPWQIMRYLNEGYGYKQVLNEIDRSNKNV